MTFSSSYANVCFALGAFLFDEHKANLAFKNARMFNIKGGMPEAAENFKEERVLCSTWPAFCIFDIPVWQKSEWRIMRFAILLSRTLIYSDTKVLQNIKGDVDLKQTIKRLTNVEDQTQFEETLNLLYWNPTLPVSHYGDGYDTSWYKFVGEQLGLICKHNESLQELQDALGRIKEEDRYVFVPHEKVPGFYPTQASKPLVTKAPGQDWVEKIRTDEKLPFTHYSLFADELAVVGQVFLNRFTKIFYIPTISEEGYSGNFLHPRDVSSAVDAKIKELGTRTDDSVQEKNGTVWVNVDKFKEAVSRNWETLVENVHNDNASAEYAIVVVKRPVEKKE